MERLFNSSVIWLVASKSGYLIEIENIGEEATKAEGYATAIWYEISATKAEGYTSDITSKVRESSISKSTTNIKLDAELNHRDLLLIVGIVVVSMIMLTSTTTKGDHDYSYKSDYVDESFLFS